MTEYSIPISVRWADLDPNLHVRHSVYYDFGAQVRTYFLSENGVTPLVMIQNNFGPVLFREEAVFKREIRFGDQLLINIKLLKLKRDFSRYSILHELVKDDGKVCATIVVDGAWMDTKIRKLITPPAIATNMIDVMPKAENFEWMD
ncbi:acyl-CoA thioesterase [Solitalea lacus]|uniref:acyl-CoA thioesterase n=1 Tax=Solitalea lacus TaxID=2911172 RepID=UPI001ED9FFD2|nr:acyl-CoA thioesterase [Solitalea lacus]UKJ05886.1 thioesterase family protein [Solitalea lacus]